MALLGTALRLLPCRVNHSKNAIVKPQAKAPEAEKREAEQAMKKVKEASQLIQTVLDPGGWAWYPTLPRSLGCCDLRLCP